MASKRDVCDQKNQIIEVGYLLKMVCDMLCIPEFLIIWPVKVVQKQIITQIGPRATN